MPETYIIAVEPVYLKQGEFCYFKSKTGIIYRIENVKGKYQVFDEKSTETQKATKEIMENINNKGIIEKRKGFFKKLTEHATKYGWFYAEIVNLIGTAVLTKIGG